MGVGGEGVPAWRAGLIVSSHSSAQGLSLTQGAPFRKGHHHDTWIRSPLRPPEPHSWARAGQSPSSSSSCESGWNLMSSGCPAQPACLPACLSSCLAREVTTPLQGSSQQFSLLRGPTRGWVGERGRSRPDMRLRLEFLYMLQSVKNVCGGVKEGFISRP